MANGGNEYTFEFADLSEFLRGSKEISDLRDISGELTGSAIVSARALDDQDGEDGLSLCVLKPNGFRALLLIRPGKPVTGWYVPPNS